MPDAGEESLDQLKERFLRFRRGLTGERLFRCALRPPYHEAGFCYCDASWPRALWFYLCAGLALLILKLPFNRPKLWVLWRTERHPIIYSRVLFVAGLGALGFSFFRLVLLEPFFDNQVWFATWEEITELIYVLAVAAGLWIFRHALFQPLRSVAPNTTASGGVPTEHPGDPSTTSQTPCSH